MRILKKTVLLLMAIIFAASLAAGPAAEARSWYWLVSNDNESIYFDSYSAYRESDGAVRCWMKWVQVDGSCDIMDTRIFVSHRRIYMYWGDCYSYNADGSLNEEVYLHWKSVLLAPDTMGYYASLKILQMVP
ncbi:hypothetical protein [Mitsuokella jalaludinii]|uniref:hypothetical protein n=1 Tax=Mitsuokella jalaludinii TaxID=187979 RepID=UPI003F9DB1D1